MADTLLSGTPGNDNLELDLLALSGAVTVDGGAGYDVLTLPHRIGSDAPMRVRIDLSQGTVSLRAADDSGWQLVPVTLRGIEALYAGKGWDPVFIGDSGDNRLSVFSPPPTTVLVGGGGHDTLEGGTTYYGGPTVDFSATAGPVLASLTTHQATSVDGNDQLIDVSNLIGSDFDDLLDGGGLNGFLNGFLHGGRGNDTLRGAAVLEGGPGDDTLERGAVASYARAPGAITASLASGSATGAAGRDSLHDIGSLIGSDFDDWLEGGSGFLQGGIGNDTLAAGVAGSVLIPGPGDDLVIGGTGVDTLSYYDAGAAVTVRVVDGMAQGVASGLDHFTSIEAVSGSPFDDRIEGGPGDDALTGGGGADTLIGGPGNDSLSGGAEVDGGDGDDRLAGYRLNGGAGRDDLSGNGFLSGGAGDDWFHLTSVAISVDGGDGFDRLEMVPDTVAVDLDRTTAVSIDMGAGTMRIGNGPLVPVAFHSIEALYDSKGWDTSFIGDDADNLLQGDSLAGGGGNDTLVASRDGAWVDGGAGVDTLHLRDPLSALALQHGVRNAIDVTRGGQFVAAVSNVERIVFGDQALAFGDRALDVAKLAFVLWSKDIVVSPALFGKGVDWYGADHVFDDLARYALSFFADKTDAQLAEQLARNVPGRSATDIVALFASHGGGADGRAYVTTLLADDAVNLANVQATGYSTLGLPCALTWGPQALFSIPGSSA